MTVDLNEYKKLYLETAEIKLSEMSALLNSIETNHNPQSIADFHRLSHSIKSQSLVMGYTQLGLAGKILEALFLAVKENKIDLRQDLVKLVRQTIFAMDRSLKSIENQQGESSISKEIQSIESHTKIKLLDP